MTYRWISTTPAAPWQERAAEPDNHAAAHKLFLTGHTHQRISGFGGCFNELGWAALSALDENARHAVLRSLFDSRAGCGFTLGRVPIGASDYALSWYSCDEHDGDLALEYFSIERDRQYLIPYIRAAMQIQPALGLFASPWSPPVWMKQPQAYNHGILRWEPEVLEAYARYLLRFAEAYQAEGLPVRQIHVQNEPDSDQKFPSCLWTGEKLREFIRDYAGPTFAQVSINCALWLGTIERGDYDAWVGPTLTDPQAARYVGGVGFQWAGKGAVQKTHMAFPELPLMQTENECGDGRNSWDYAAYVFGLIHHYLGNGVGAYMYWNMVLAPGGKSTWGWNQNAMITVDPASGEATYNPEYYVMRHLSACVPPGSLRCGTHGDWSAHALCFRRPDGGHVVVLNNPYPEARAVTIDFDEESVTLDLAPRSFHTLVEHSTVDIS